MAHPAQAYPQGKEVWLLPQGFQNEKKYQEEILK